MESTTAKIQHVNKASSDQLLRKFAELEDLNQPDNNHNPRKKQQEPKRQKRCKPISKLTVNSEISSPVSRNGTSKLVERRSLLSPMTPTPVTNQRSTLLRQLGIGRSKQFRSKNKSFIGAIEKTWRRTIEGASRVFIEKKNYNRHKRLINDVV